MGADDDKGQMEDRSRIERARVTLIALLVAALSPVAITLLNTARTTRGTRPRTSSRPSGRSIA